MLTHKKFLLSMSDHVRACTHMRGHVHMVQSPICMGMQNKICTFTFWTENPRRNCTRVRKILHDKTSDTRSNDVSYFCQVLCI